LTTAEMLGSTLVSEVDSATSVTTSPMRFWPRSLRLSFRTRAPASPLTFTPPNSASQRPDR
jgi:hypothetical protein